MFLKQATKQKTLKHFKLFSEIESICKRFFSQSKLIKRWNIELLQETLNYFKLFQRV